MKRLYVVRLTVEERGMLESLVNTGRVAAYTRRHAQLLLLVAQENTVLLIVTGMRQNT